MLGYIEPVGTVVLAALFLAERPSGLGLAGGALILGGGALVLWEEAGRQKAVDEAAGRH